MRRRMPLSTPGGMPTETVRAIAARPLPRHCVQGWRRTVPAPPAEKHVKDVIERTISPAGHILGGDRLHRPEPVVLGPALRVAEDLVGFVDFLEALLGLRVILAHIGVVLAGQPAECPFDLVL